MRPESKHLIETQLEYLMSNRNEPPSSADFAFRIIQQASKTSPNSTTLWQEILLMLQVCLPFSPVRVTAAVLFAGIILGAAMSGFFQNEDAQSPYVASGLSSYEYYL